MELPAEMAEVFPYQLPCPVILVTEDDDSGPTTVAKLIAIQTLLSKGDIERLGLPLEIEEGFGLMEIHFDIDGTILLAIAINAEAAAEKFYSFEQTEFDQAVAEGDALEATVHDSIEAAQAEVAETELIQETLDEDGPTFAQVMGAGVIIAVSYFVIRGIFRSLFA